MLKPVSSSFQEAAAIPIAGVTALQGLRDHGRIQPGQKVLVDGASGGVGTLAIQIAKSSCGIRCRVQHGQDGYGVVDWRRPCD